MAADFERILDSLLNGTESPKVRTSTEDTLLGGVARPFNWSDHEAVMNFFGELVSDGFPDYSSWSWEEVETTVNAMSDKMNAGLTTKSTGIVIADKLGIINTTTSELTGGKWSDIWSPAELEEKVRIIWEYLIAFSMKRNDKGKPNSRHTEYKNRSDYGYSIKLGLKRTTFANLSPDGSDINKYNTVENETLLAQRFAVLINRVFFNKMFEDTDMSDETQIRWVFPSDLSDADFKAKIEELRNYKLKKAKAMADLSEKLEDGDEGKEERDAFFKKVEQCILLCGAEKLGVYRKGIRAAELVDQETYGTKKELKRSKRFPYGGKIICVNTDANLFMNYCDSDGETFRFTTEYLNKFISKVNYKFVISKVNRIKVGGQEYDIEMPLLFENQSNFLNKMSGGNVPSGFKGTKVFVNEKETAPSNLTVSDLIKAPAAFANSSITFEDISIKFHGENQATAKTNVDVDLNIGVTNLLAFQTIFTNNAYYINKEGEGASIPYDYSLMDLITYLHRSDLGDVYKNLSTGGARLFNPTYFKSFNRLVVKLIPVVSAAEPSYSTKEKEYFDRFKAHIENTPMILDLALIDHTIDKESENNNAKIKISYKGYVKSFLQDPKMDIIRTPEKIEEEIEKEVNLIEELVGLTDKAAIEKIDTFNKIRKDETIDLTKGIPYLNTLINDGRYYKLKVNSNTFKDSVTKDYKLLGTRTIYDSIGSGSIIDISGSLSETQDPIKDKVEANKDYEINFFYLGDLIDVAMYSIYNRSFRNEEVRRSSDTLRESFKDFPLKVILPSFDVMKPDPAGTSWIRGEKISVADFPIAETWFTQWWKSEIIEAEIQFYTIGTLISRLINNLFNNLILEDCYLNGSHEKKQFGVRTDFGLFSKDGKEENSKFKSRNRTWFDHDLNYQGDTRGLQYDSFLQVDKRDAPYFKKDPNLPRSEHCNFIVVYPRIAMFSDYKEIENNVESWEKYNIPIFHRQRNSGILNKPSSFTDSISFTKEEANYRREARFQAESLYTLAQLASVYDATCKSKFALDLFPGMLVYINAGLYQSPSVMNSIANILGMGGYHIIESVTHTAKIDVNLLGEMVTTTEAVWVSNGTIKLDGDTPTPNKTRSVLITPTGAAEEDAAIMPEGDPMAEAGNGENVTYNINKSWAEGRRKLKNGKYTFYLINHDTNFKTVEAFKPDGTPRSGEKPKKYTLLSGTKVWGLFATGINGFEDVVFNLQIKITSK